MDFLDNVVKSSNAIIKDRIKNPLNSIKLSDPFGASSSSSPSPASADAATQQQAPANKSLSDEQATPPPNTNNGQDESELDDSGLRRKSSGSNMNPQLKAIAADAQAVGQRTVEGAKNIGNFLFSMGVRAGQTVSQTANKVKQAVENTSMFTESTKEQQDFIREHGGSIQAGELPWLEYQDETKRNEMREQILSLSQDKRNFVRSPPDDANFEFDPKKYYPIALSLLKEDPTLGKLRAELVPKLVNEESFWRNYFFRISMLKKMNDGPKSWSSSRSSSGEGPDVMTDTMISSNQQDQKLDLPETTSCIQPSIDRQQSLDSDSKKLFKEADDLQNKLKELDIGLFDGQDDDDGSCSWDEELQQALEEFELLDLDEEEDSSLASTDVLTRHGD